jgi:hypothetical protein
MQSSIFCNRYSHNVAILHQVLCGIPAIHQDGTKRQQLRINETLKHISHMVEFAFSIVDLATQQVLAIVKLSKSHSTIAPDRQVCQTSSPNY